MAISPGMYIISILPCILFACKETIAKHFMLYVSLAVLSPADKEDLNT